MLQVTKEGVSFIGKLCALRELLNNLAKRYPPGATLLEYCKEGR